MSDFFQFQESSLKKEQSDRVIDAVLYSDPLPEVYFLCIDALDNAEVKLMKAFFRNLRLNFQFAVIFPLKFFPTEKELAKELEKFFFFNTIDLNKIIPPNSKIITFGQSLYSTTKNTDIQTQAFYDTVFNKSYFYSPYSKCWVFPVDALDSIFNFPENRIIDAFPKEFFRAQVERALKFKPSVIRLPALNKVVIEDFGRFVEDHLENKMMTLDMETTSLNYLSGSIICITMSFDGVTGYFLSAEKFNAEEMNRLLKNKFIIGANLKFDCKFLRYLGVSNAHVDFDTLNAGHCLNEMRSNSLKTHAFLMTYYGGYDDALREYTWKYPRAAKNYGFIPLNIIFDYAVMDAIVNFQVFTEMMNQLKADPPLYNYYFNEVIPSIEMYLEAEMRGVYINWDRVREVGKILDKELEDVRQEIFKTFGKQINLESGRELGKFIEYDLKWPCIERAKPSTGGYYLTNKRIMNEWKKRGKKEAALFLKYSEIQALRQTFIGEEHLGNGLWKYRCIDSRIHPTFWVMLAKSHRNRSEAPNFQNFPKRGKKAELIRSIFSVPSPEFLIAETDSAGLQLRICAAQSGDKTMTDAFRHSDGDLHSLTAFGTFVQPDDCEVEVEDTETGKKYSFMKYEDVNIKRNGVKVTVKVHELLPTDSIFSED